MSLRNFKRGDRFAPAADQLNAWNDAARGHILGESSTPPDPQAQQWQTLGRNTGTTVVDRFDAVEMLGPSITDEENPAEFDQLVAFDIQHPADPLAPGQIAIAQETIAPGKIGRVQVFGVTIVREIQVDDEGHTRARPGVTGELVSAKTGPAAILWKSPAEQQIRRAVVSIDQAKPGAGTRWGRLVSSSRNAGEWSWEYTAELVDLDESLDWQQIEGTDLVAARNTIEAGNTDQGVQGNGVNATTIPQGFAIVPAGAGAVVQLTGPYGATDTDPGFYMFSVANLVDGECVQP